MVKPEWGTKRHCPKCNTRFYDLAKDDPVTCTQLINIQHTNIQTYSICYRCIGKVLVVINKICFIFKVEICEFTRFHWYHNPVYRERQIINKLTYNRICTFLKKVIIQVLINITKILAMGC